jgi:hypothetical protein
LLAISAWRLNQLRGRSLLVLLPLLSVLVWLNLDYTREAYDAHGGGAWNGGVRYGFPMVLWDGGFETRVTITPDGPRIARQHYGGLQPAGLVVDLLVACGALALVVWLLHQSPVLPDGTSSARARLDIPLHPLTCLLALALGGGLLWANLSTDVQVVQQPDGGIDYCQEMGWPLFVYRAHQPHLRLADSKGTPRFTQSQVLSYLRTHPNSWYLNSHWFFGRLTLNIVLNLALIVAASAAWEFAHVRLRRSPYNQSQVPSRPDSSTSPP